VEFGFGILDLKGFGDEQGSISCRAAAWIIATQSA
jgi:hypothetical protein